MLLAAFVPQAALDEGFWRYFPDGAHVVVDATGVSSVLRSAVEIAKDKPWDDSVEVGARLVIQGSYADDFSLPYRPVFLKELTIHSPRDVQPRDINAMLEIIERGKLDLGGLISDVRLPESAPDTYVNLAKKDSELITVAFNWHA